MSTSPLRGRFRLPGLAAGRPKATRRRRDAAPHRTVTTSVTEQFGHGYAHAVQDEIVSDWLTGGQLRAVCGRVIVPAVMTAPMGTPCPHVHRTPGSCAQHTATVLTVTAVVDMAGNCTTYHPMVEVPPVLRSL